MLHPDKSCVIECVEEGPFRWKYIKDLAWVERPTHSGTVTHYHYEWTDDIEQARVYEPMEAWPTVPFCEVRYRPVEDKDRSVRVIAHLHIPLVVTERAISQEQAEDRVNERSRFENLLEQELGDLWQHLEEEHGAHLDHLEVLRDDT